MTSRYLRNLQERIQLRKENKPVVEKIRVEKVYIRDAMSRDGRAFKTYSANYQNRWYNLKGFGRENIKEGDFLTGIVEERPYKDKEGNDKISYDFTLADKTMQFLLDEIDSLRSAIDVLNQAVFTEDKKNKKTTKQVDQPEDAPEEEVSVDDIPW